MTDKPWVESEALENFTIRRIGELIHNAEKGSDMEKCLKDFQSLREKILKIKVEVLEDE